MIEVEKNYKIRDGKLHAIIEVFHHWRDYLE